MSRQSTKPERKQVWNFHLQMQVLPKLPLLALTDIERVNRHFSEKMVTPLF